MSHTHSHGPGQPAHSHGPPAGLPQQQQPQPKQVIPAPDPVMQAVIEASFVPVDITLGPPDNVTALCQMHSLEQCAACDVDYSALNRISRLLLLNPNLRCPPPPQMVTQKLSQAVTTMKEEGNKLYKETHHAAAIQRYTMAANLASQRPPWEASQIPREEFSTILSNRSAAFYEMGDYISALVDAETVIQIRKPWSKGYFRKAKALMKLQSYQEAKETLEIGLSVEPDNQEMADMLETAANHLNPSKKKELTAA
ncbi:hypothetical protein PHLGIDRAFT_36673 [Phlebiopsis gigantea 11061_1 CR5-6]|uniref:Uncharacterized protein n=1 Tax=Phlebiopsis gigantea (strain 11061_1 CR5-6) TaxID=745531 RepID=A0A0C3RUZ1_PHLG1|nr:hypothetical protein PHLGIDRAFT_36673 [Phlebiopsis gigantea 11061_1 CR5-6]